MWRVRNDAPKHITREYSDFNVAEKLQTEIMKAPFQ